jgi:cell wall-associated NlpC family hydrolase
LVADLQFSARGDPRIESEVEHRFWYSRHARQEFGAWGPHPRTYPLASFTANWPVEQKRQRVIATALRFVGYAYQHHHIPDWDPPPDWPWKPTCAGRNGRGVDCSNFTGFVYNLAFGVRLNTDVGRQAELRHTAGGMPIQRVELPESYNARIATLRTGDLVFIRSRRGNISHVVLWLGSVGVSPDGVPLILDSHGENVHDSQGQLIPCGIYLRPFREDSWYNHSASHALRVFPDR